MHMVYYYLSFRHRFKWSNGQGKWLLVTANERWRVGRHINAYQHDNFLDPEGMQSLMFRVTL